MNNYVKNTRLHSDNSDTHVRMNCIMQYWITQLTTAYTEVVNLQ